MWMQKCALSVHPEPVLHMLCGNKCCQIMQGLLRRELRPLQQHFKRRKLSIIETGAHMPYAWACFEKPAIISSMTGNEKAHSRAPGGLSGVLFHLHVFSSGTHYPDYTYFIPLTLNNSFKGWWVGKDGSLNDRWFGPFFGGKCFKTTE